MQILVISDIHANLAALEAVLADSDGEWDLIWCLGDVVGYGPDPNECVERLRQYDHLSLSGNHDWAVLGRLDLENFNEIARAAISWTDSVLSEACRTYLESLPSLLVQEPFTLAHASPRHPVWEYISDVSTAETNFHHFETPICLVGHTHTAIIYKQDEAGVVKPAMPDYGQKIMLEETRLIINPGSVGQPRDYDPRAAYGLLETEEMTWEHRRVAYPIKKTQERMERLGLPEPLIDRLEYGW
jgi:diadenosine tetraphosphatase ApaH/serine/threonine PP2A family protein phosphatase